MRIFLTLVLMSCLATAVSAATILVHASGARECYEATLLHASLLNDRSGIAACDRALEVQDLDANARLAVLVNRSDIHLRMLDFQAAALDAEQAIALDPELAAAYLNRGAAMVGLKRDADAVTALDKAVSLGTDHPELAYFNRALAKEGLGDVKGAYLDYRKALEADPKFQRAADELIRFRVVAPR